MKRATTKFQECQYCGKDLPKRTLSHYCGEPPERYTWAQTHTEKPHTREEAQRLTNQTIISVKRSGIKGDDYIRSFATWDGETCIGYAGGRFCTLDCCERYAEMAAQTFERVRERDSA